MKEFNSNDIFRIYDKLDAKIIKLCNYIESVDCKEPYNIGGGIGLYAGRDRCHWDFKSLEAGSNITLTDNGSKITISSTGGGAVTCDDVKDCLGISNAGDPNKFLNEQGDWVTVSGGGSVTNFSFTNNSIFTGVVSNPTTTPNLTLDLLLVDGGTF